MPKPLTMVLLPGLDGTGLLFRPLLEALPETIEPIVIAYPPNEPLDYRELESLAFAQLPRDRPFVLVAESFSGPIGVRIAAREPEGLRGLVLVASFVKNPMSAALGLLRPLVRAPLFWFGPPRSLIRKRLAGPDASDDLVERILAANQLVKAAVIARRVREVLAVDATGEFMDIRAPLLYLRGEVDRQISCRIADDLTTLRPDLTIQDIPGPHLILQREPERSVEAMRSIVLS